MTRRNFRVTFDRMPCTQALWDRMLEFSRSYPGFALVSDAPFLCADDESATVRTANMYMRAVEETDSVCVLWRELLLVECMVHEGHCSHNEVLLIEATSQYLLRTIQDAARATDLQYIKYLRSLGRLN